MLVCPTPNRRQKLLAEFQKHLVANTFVAHGCRQPRWQSDFFNTTCMGRVGRATVSPVYARHHANHHDTTVTESIRAALVTIATLATNALLHTLPISTAWRPLPLVYADASCEQNTLTRPIFSCLHACFTVSPMTLAQDGCPRHVIHVFLTSLRLSTLHSSQSLSSSTSSS